MTPVLLAIGTTHPLNIAGVGLDASVAARLGIRLVTVVAGVSAQSAGAVLARTEIDAATIAAQFEALDGVPIGAIHVGALVGRRSVSAVARELVRYGGVPIVCDPVIAASGGDRIADDVTVAALRDELFVRCTLVTPNLDEARILLDRQIDDIAAMERAAADLCALGPDAVLVKGGHLAGDPVDVLVSAAGVKRLGSPRLAGGLRGTGDLLACATAARLAHGDALETAVDRARDVVRASIASGVMFAGARTLP